MPDPTQPDPIPVTEFTAVIGTDFVVRPIGALVVRPYKQGALHGDAVRLQISATRTHTVVPKELLDYLHEARHERMWNLTPAVDKLLEAIDGH